MTADATTTDTRADVAAPESTTSSTTNSTILSEKKSSTPSTPGTTTAPLTPLTPKDAKAKLRKDEKADISRSSSLLDLLHVPTPEPIKFAPLNVPTHRRAQTAAVAVWSVMIPITTTAFFGAFIFPFLWPFLIAYAVWFLFVDKAWERKGGRPQEWVRRSAFWRYFAGYYPVRTIKEADLPADRKYVFGYHPHGIISMGALCTFATEATGFSELFPGIKPHLLTLDSNFRVPFYRDILMAMGISSVSKRSCRSILKKGAGNSITIVIGGASESLYAHPGTHNLTLKKRFGFVKVAIREGADLVPVYGFGENDIYEQLPNAKGSAVYKFQKNFQSMFGFTFPLFHGRGIFNYNYGLMPFRHDIVTVIGKPIKIKQNPNPSDEEVQEYHKLYIEGLQEIWDKYKDEFAKDRTSELKLVA
ncbi:hypothetical protein VHUM_03771 [Vanrija humicola]|uniref:Diacylglycerol O-acyltransferase n=1 Tax=Vanrija humicola TaxID=5417 RepID=A0A7D8ZHV6_VANHU|nr:hypothetical protein VHUM_03771 [Vanrija humicola]